MASTTYTVVKGDTLSEIAVKYNTTVNNLLKLNPDITNKDLIYIGQVIVISGDAATKTTTKAQQRPKITNFGLQANTERTVFATWAWDKDKTKNYAVEWKYATGDGVAFNGSITTETSKQSVYNAPENATKVTFRVKPISQTYKKNKLDTNYWTADYSDKKTYSFADNPPGTPPVPTITLDGYKLTARLDNIDDVNATSVRFQIEENGTNIFKTTAFTIKNGSVSYSRTVNANSEYRVRCQAINKGLDGDWSDWSDRYVSSPAATEGIYLLYALSSTSVDIYWYDVAGVTGYEVQYTTVKSYFDTNISGSVISKSIGSKEEPVTVGHMIISGLESGSEYFFRVRSVNHGSTNSYSAWSEIKSVVIAAQPTSPTTWSSATTVNTGDPLILYWTHNSSDNSIQTEANLEITVDDSTFTYHMNRGTCFTADSSSNKIVDLDGFTLTDGAVIKILMSFANTSENVTLNVNNTGPVAVGPSDSGSCYWAGGALVIFTYDGTYWNITDNNADPSNESYSIDTSQYTEGTVIKWKVQTAGLLENENGTHIFGSWSVVRTIKIYSPPALSLTVTNSSGESIEQLESYPINIIALEGSDNQIPIGYHISITANDSYETVDNLGNTKTVNAGGEIYQHYFDTSSNPMELTLSAGDLDLENGMSYKITCTVSMDSGLTGEAISEFTVSWADEEYWPDAEISYDEETYSTIIQPYCRDENDNEIEGITLSLYRREFDGSFTELITGLDNTIGTNVVDPHPSLDYARYRVVAISNATGAVSFYDIPGYPIGETSVIIQWDAQWTNFDVSSEDELEQPIWTGSLLKLPYNIDISDKYDGDVEFIKYIGRNNPVGYYGTQIGHTSTWNMEIDKSDKETLYALRRLAIWMGNVYIREPSGSGYWAKVSVSFDQNHCKLTIPVSLEVTRVEGGI